MYAVQSVASNPSVKVTHVAESCITLNTYKDFTALLKILDTEFKHLEEQTHRLASASRDADPKYKDLDVTSQFVYDFCKTGDIIDLRVLHKILSMDAFSQYDIYKSKLHYVTFADKMITLPCDISVSLAGREHTLSIEVDASVHGSKVLDSRQQDWGKAWAFLDPRHRVLDRGSDRPIYCLFLAQI